MRETIDLNSLYPLMREVLDAGGVFRFYPRGTSMLPMLREGIDSVELAAVDPAKVEIGDVLFYRRKNGQFVLHRLVDFTGNTLTMCGDNQFVCEFGLERDQVLAKLVGYYADEEHKLLDTDEYRAYAKERVRRLPLYVRKQKLHTVYRAGAKIKHMLFNRTKK